MQKGLRWVNVSSVVKKSKTEVNIKKLISKFFLVDNNSKNIYVTI